MHLKELSLNNFRSFKSSTVSFHKELTILVGENNSGKSNTIDALRLLTPPLSGRRDMYCQLTDIRFSSGTGFELSARYADLNNAQKGRLISASKDKSLTEAVFGLIYDETRGGYPPRPTIWAGKAGQIPEPGSHEIIRHVYLPALRDAKYALASGNPTRIYALLKHFMKDVNDSDLIAALSRKSEHTILKNIGAAVNIGLDKLTSGVRQQSTTLGFSKDEKLIDIARDLKFSLADHGITPEDLSYSGHGYANLLYMATIAIELENVSNADLTLFLVEEPEAHLHPQLQSAVLSFLKECSVKSRTAPNNDGAPAGEIQVVVATHSPNLTASVPSKNVVFLRAVIPDTKEDPVNASNSEEVTNFCQTSQQTTSSVARRETRAISIANLITDLKIARKIDRYIDVTKASFMFGGRMLLVEGIAEALLLPIFAEKFVLKGNEPALRRFRSATFVPIDGVDFEPYIKLLVTPQNGIRIADKVVVITDGDGPTKLDNGLTAGQHRKQVYDTIATGLGAETICKTHINDYTLETELIFSGNKTLLKDAYLKIHPRSEAKWNAATNKGGPEGATAIHALFGDSQKGDFAQTLAEIIEDYDEFVVPKYLRDAILSISE